MIMQREKSRASRWLYLCLGFVLVGTGCKVHKAAPSEDKSLGRIISHTIKISTELTQKIDTALRKLFTQGDYDEITTLIRKGGKDGAAALASFHQQLATSQQRVSKAVATLHNAAIEFPSGQHTQLFARFQSSVDVALDELVSMAEEQYRILPQIAGANKDLHKELLFNFSTEVWVKQLREAGYHDHKVMAKIARLQEITLHSKRRSNLHAFLQSAGRVPLKNRKLNNLPTWEIVAPDGSKHYLLGTMHHHFPQEDILTHPELKRVMDKASIFMPENKDWDSFGKRFSAEANHPRAEEFIDYKGNLRQELGEDYWAKLQQEFKLPEIPENIHPSVAAKFLGDEVIDPNLEEMDIILIRFAKKADKKSFH